MEWVQAFRLVTHNYQARGYEPRAERRLRFTPYHALPDTAVVVVSNADHAELTTLLWDLGAAAVVLPADPLADLPALVGGLMGQPA